MMHKSKELFTFHLDFTELPGATVTIVSLFGKAKAAQVHGEGKLL